jgi:glutaminase
MNEQEVKDIIGKITDAVKVALGDKWDEAQHFAKSESKKFAQNTAEIVLWKETGKITEEQGKVLLRMHQRSMKMVLTALEGISLVLAEKAINAAIDAIGDIVNGLIGWDLF